MTSFTSSDPFTLRRGILRFPPRSELPRGVTIAKLPFLGRTWYERGFWYWCRRVYGVILLLLTLAIYVGIIIGVMNAAGPPGSPGYLAVLVGEIVFSLATSVFAFRHLRRTALAGNTVGRGRQASRAGMGASFLAFQGGVLGGALLAASVLLTGGFALALLGIWLIPVPPTEQYARRMLADELQMHRNYQSVMHHRSSRKRHKR